MGSYAHIQPQGWMWIEQKMSEALLSNPGIIDGSASGIQVLFAQLTNTVSINLASNQTFLMAIGYSFWDYNSQNMVIGPLVISSSNTDSGELMYQGNLSIANARLYIQNRSVIYDCRNCSNRLYVLVSV